MAFPRGSDDMRPARFVVLALGKLGGQELNYSSDIDLIFLYDVEGQTSGPRAVSNAEFFARMGGELVRLLSDHTALGLAYRVDMRLRPEGDQGALARSLTATLGYYVTTGRTWERQAIVQGRPIARRFIARAGVSRRDHTLRLPPLPQRGRDRRDQDHEAADRATNALGRDRRGRGQDWPRRHPRRRIRRPVPPASPRRPVP